MESKDEARLVLAGDSETGEIYAAQVIDEEKHGHGPETLPLVQILRVEKYPSQRAIQDHRVALELPAIAHGTILRMAIIRELSEEEREAVFSRPWKVSLRDAQKQALREAATEKEREIIRRHLDGEYRRRRLVKSYTMEEIRIMKALSGKRNK